jgi:palmitoyltransferase ZDHHC13/17
MWAAYKGFPACVDLFLRWGANVYARDDQGFTALHWALVKGAQGPIQKLIEYGADRFAENNEGKTPAITAEDMNTTRQWHRALTECGYHKDGRPRYFPFSFVKDRRSFMSKFFLFWPFVGLFCVIWLLSHLVVFAAIPIAAIVGYGLHEVAQQALKWAPPGMNHMHRTVSD